ncbi:hypothetical protein OG978_12570 [Streptomyces sp. NBC_01591]|uniref:hypothetical protein n=1 Tax=Streptomyces sp. NBC_01591 TaxID=2975888 RepID=UPI002DD90642|nr:hypothetical protein [Streptomyces sp. NBC_01591]WSD68164.1 hypothetical protein OG978_12570 [Streptomyces sp. NBC_01591]
MHPDNVLTTFARISAPSSRPAASEQAHRYAALITALRQRGLECTVEYGLSDYIVHAELPDGSSLIISPPQEPSSEHPESPESWTVTRHRSAEPAVYEVVYDSEPDGPDARHGGSVPDLLTAVDAHLDRLGVPPRPEQERSVEERAADAAPHRAGFVPDPSRVSAALSPSPSAGQHAVPAGPPTASSAHTALPPARPSSALGR